MNRGLTANEVCEECGECIGANPKPQCVQRSSFSNMWGHACPTYAAGAMNQNYCYDKSLIIGLIAATSCYECGVCDYVQPAVVAVATPPPTTVDHTPVAEAEHVISFFEQQTAHDTLSLLAAEDAPAVTACESTSCAEWSCAEWCNPICFSLEREVAGEYTACSVDDGTETCTCNGMEERRRR